MCAQAPDGPEESIKCPEAGVTGVLRGSIIDAGN